MRRTLVEPELEESMNVARVGFRWSLVILGVLGWLVLVPVLDVCRSALHRLRGQGLAASASQAARRADHADPATSRNIKSPRRAA